MSSKAQPVNQNRSLSGMNLSIISLIAIGVSILMLAVYDHYRYQPIMTVDVELIMQTKLNQLQSEVSQNSSSTIDKQAALKLSQQWATQLADEVSRLSREYHAIVFTRPAVIEGSTDMTQLIMNNLN